MKTIEEQTENLYSDDLPYHNFDHVLESLEIAMEAVWESFSYGVKVDAQIVYYAILFHDAGFHEDHESKGFDTKEEYSAHLAEESLRDYNVSDKIIEKVKQCIIGTHVDSSLQNNEEKIVRAADIYNISDDYQVFFDKNVLLKKEAEILNETNINWEDWKQSTKEILNQYLSEDLTVGDDLELMSFEDARENLDRYMTEDTDKLQERENVLFPNE